MYYTHMYTHTHTCICTSSYRHLPYLVTCPKPKATPTMANRKWHEDFGQGLLQFLVWRSFGDPRGMLSEAFAGSCASPVGPRCPCMVSYRSLRRSSGDPVEILSGDPCIKILKTLRAGAWKLFWDAHRKLLYEDLVRSSLSLSLSLYAGLYGRSCFCSCDSA